MATVIISRASAGPIERHTARAVGYTLPGGIEMTWLPLSQVELTPDHEYVARAPAWLAKKAGLATTNAPWWKKDADTEEALGAFSMINEFFEEYPEMAEANFPEIPGMNPKFKGGWPHQRRDFALLQARAKDRITGHYIAGWMGSGKTATTVMLAMAILQARRVLVICTQAGSYVWKQAFAGLADDRMAVDKAHVSNAALSTGDKATKALAQMGSGAFVLNYDKLRLGASTRNEMGGWNTPKKTRLQQLLEGGSWDLIICDESHRLKSPTTARFRAMTAIRAKNPQAHVICLSGTGMPNGGLDILTQITIIAPHEGSYYALRARFFKKDGYGWVLRDEAEFVRFLRKYLLVTPREVVERNLPPLHVITYNVQLTEKEHEEHEHTLYTITEDSPIVLTAMMRAQQFLSALPSRISAIIELIADMPEGEKVVIFYRFKETLESLKTAIESEFLKCTYAQISGDRKEMADFIHGPARFCLVQWQSGSESIDLTVAPFAILADPTWSYSEYDQGISRIYRPGQTKTTTVYRMCAIGPVVDDEDGRTMDEMTYSAVDSKKDFSARVLAEVRKGHGGR